MSDSLAAVQARVAQLQALVGALAPSAQSSAGGSPLAGPASTSGADFAGVLARAGLTDPSSTPGEKAVGIAKQYLGVPYAWGGTDPETGLDCSGLTRLVYGRLGISLPRTSSAQSSTGTAVGSLAQAQPGDLVFFGSPVHHVGIYLGNGTMLDAPHRGTRVQIRKVYETPSAIRRVLPDGPVAGSSGPAPAANSAAASPLASAAAGVPSGLAGTPYAENFESAGRRYRVDPALLSAVAKAESGYRASAVSGAGARGLMQLMPATARSLGVNPDVPAQAVDGAARLLADHLRSFHGRVDLALAAYSAGPAAVRRSGGVPPNAETRTYVHRVMANWGELR